MNNPKNRVVIGLPERYESAKEAVRVLEKRISDAKLVAEQLPLDDLRDALINTLDGVYDGSV